MIQLPALLETQRRRWRRLDRVVRMIVAHWALGMGLGAVLAASLLAFDLLGLRTLLGRSDIAAVGASVFVALFALTFGGVLAAGAAMQAARDEHEPQGGARAQTSEA